MRTPRALSLAEVLLAAALTLVLIGGLVLMYRVSLRARLRQEAQQRPYRAALTTLARIRGELRVVQVLNPSRLSRWERELSYRKAVFRPDEMLRVDGSGTPLWRPETYRIFYEPDGGVWRECSDPHEPRQLLGQLGDNGYLVFMRESEPLLDLELRAQFSGSSESSVLTNKMWLQNQP